VRTYVNTYGVSDVVLERLVDKLLGRSSFVGRSPVDPFWRQVGHEAVEVPTRAVIFDLDGVIVSTDAMHYAAWKSIADDEGIAAGTGAGDRLRGVSRMECLEIILELAAHLYSQAEKQALADTKNARYRELLEGLSAADVSHEVSFVLKALRARGIKLAVGSSSRNTPLIWVRSWLHSLMVSKPQVRSRPNGMPQTCPVVSTSTA